MLRQSVVFTLVPDDRRHDVIAFLQMRGEVIGVVIPVVGIAAGGAKTDFCPVYIELISGIRRHMNNKGVGDGRQLEIFTEMVYFIGLQVRFGVRDPLGRPSGVPGLRQAKFGEPYHEDKQEASHPQIYKIGGDWLCCTVGVVR